MKTKKDLAIEVLGNYENFGCELKNEVYYKVLSRLENCKRNVLKDCLQFVNDHVHAEKKGAAAYVIFILTGISLNIHQL